MHELGHLLNLDHSALNDECYDDAECGGDGWTHLPTMYKFVVPKNSKYSGEHPQISLHKDDIAWLSWIYREFNGNITDAFCTVRGAVYDIDGRGFQGAQVVVREEENPYIVSRSAITGADYRACAESGKYVLPGLRPGKKYKITYGPIPNWCGSSDSTCGLASGINPYAPPRTLESGEVTVGGEYTFECDDSSEEIEADALQISANLESGIYMDYSNLGFRCEPGEGKAIPLSASGEDVEEETYTPSGLKVDKKGWCSLVPSSSSNLGIVWYLIPIFTMVIIRQIFIKIQKAKF